MKPQIRLAYKQLFCAMNIFYCIVQVYGLFDLVTSLWGQLNIYKNV